MNMDANLAAQIRAFRPENMFQERLKEAGWHTYKLGDVHVVNAFERELPLLERIVGFKLRALNRMGVQDPHCQFGVDYTNGPLVRMDFSTVPVQDDGKDLYTIVITEDRSENPEPCPAICTGITENGFMTNSLPYAREMLAHLTKHDPLLTCTLFKLVPVDSQGE